MRHKNYMTVDKIKHFINTLNRRVQKKLTELPPFHYTQLESAFVPALDESFFKNYQWTKIESNSFWGKPGADFIMRSSFAVPDQSCGKVLALNLPIGNANDFCHPEALVYIDAKPLAGLDCNHQEIALPEIYQDGKSHDLLLHGWASRKRLGQKRETASARSPFLSHQGIRRGLPR